MKPINITGRQLAADIDVSPSRISDLVRGMRPISADTALRLGVFFGMDPRLWLNLQTEFDLRTVTRELSDKVAPRTHIFQPKSVCEQAQASSAASSCNCCPPC